MNNVTTSRNRERFVRLAERRVTRAIKDMRLVGNLSNKSNYSYDDEDAEKIVVALEKELRLLKKRFETSDSEDDITFKL